MAQSADVLIVGGGLAGSAAAITLARAGRHVALLEREREARHKVCGEFLSAEALALLDVLGVSPAALGAVVIGGVRLCSERRVTETALPFPAMSLTRRRLDAALLEAAEGAGVRVVRGASVEAFAPDGQSWRAVTGDGESFVARDAVLATGKHDLRGFVRPPGPQSDLVGMKMYWRLAPAQAAALQGHVELLLYPGGYGGLEPVEDGIANLCCLIQRKVLTKLGGWDGFSAMLQQTCRYARERLAGAEPLLPKPLAISAIPYGFVRAAAAGERLWAVGDQAAVIPSFTGDGMSIALYSGVRAAKSLLAGETAMAFQQDLRATLQPQVARATVIARALLSGPCKQLIAGAVPMWPSLLRWTAAATRIPPAALVRAARIAQ